MRTASWSGGCVMGSWASDLGARGGFVIDSMRSLRLPALAFLPLVIGEVA